MTSPYVLHDVLTGVYSITGSKYNVVVKGIDMHEPGTLNPSYFDGIIVLSQKNEDMEFMDEVLSKKIPHDGYLPFRGYRCAQCDNRRGQGHGTGHGLPFG